MSGTARTFLLALVCLLVLLDQARGEDAKIDSVCQGDGPVEEGCPLQGNGDFYGLGVRMGIYFQWLTSWLANNFLPEEIIGSLETNSIFLLALFSTVFVYSVQPDKIRVVDILVIHQLCVGFLFSVMSLWGYRTMYYKTEGPGGRRHFGGFGTHFRLYLMSAITCYGVWFWMHGITDMVQCDQRVACGGLRTFFFASLKIRSWSTRGVNLSIALVAAIYYGVMAVTATVAGIFYLERKITGKDPKWEIIGKPDRDVALDKRELTTWYIILSIFNLFWLVFAITSIEFTLNLNHMNNVVGSTGLVGAGQLIPIFIGMISLLKVIYELACQNVPWLKRKDEGDESSPAAAGEPLDPAREDDEEEGEGYDGGFDSPQEAQHKSSRNHLGLGLSRGVYSSALQHPSTSPLPYTPHGLENSPPAQTSSSQPSRRRIAPHRPRRPQPKRSLTHRILLAWLPWLNMFSWARQSLTPTIIRDSGLFSRSPLQHQQEEMRERNPEVGLERLNPPTTRNSNATRARGNENTPNGNGNDVKRAGIDHVRGQSSISTTTTLAGGVDESPSKALLASPAPMHGFQPDTTGLMAEGSKEADAGGFASKQNGTDEGDRRGHRERSSDTIRERASDGDTDMGSV